MSEEAQDICLRLKSSGDGIRLVGRLLAEGRMVEVAKLGPIIEHDAQTVDEAVDWIRKQHGVQAVFESFAIEETTIGALTEA